MRKLTITQDNIKLDLGCGQFKRGGFIGMDRLDFGQEIIWDINHGIPLPDNSVSEIYTSHFVEHLREHEIFNFIQELKRVCKDKAVVTIICPHSKTEEAYYICHYTRWNWQRVSGICLEFKELNLINIKYEGINLIADLVITK